MYSNKRFSKPNQIIRSIFKQETSRYNSHASPHWNFKYFLVFFIFPLQTYLKLFVACALWKIDGQSLLAVSPGRRVSIFLFVYKNHDIFFQRNQPLTKLVQSTE